MGTTYERYPKPKADMTKGQSAKKVSSPSKGGQHHIGGAMGKHQTTGSGAEGVKGGGNPGHY
jgi:hypothetical protein